MTKKILIVDDDETNNKLAARFLGSRGYDVVTTVSAFDTASLITRERPDLVLVDVQMPGLSGDVLVRISKRRNVAPHCPLILYSTRDTVELAQLAKECGADGYIHKSGHMFELADQLERYLGKT